MTLIVKQRSCASHWDTGRLENSQKIIYGTDSEVTVVCKVWNKAMIRSRYNHLPHLNQDTTWESGKTQENLAHKSPENK